MKISEVITEAGTLGKLARSFFGDVNVDATLDAANKFTRGRVQGTASPTLQRFAYIDFDKLRPQHQGEIFVVKVRDQEFFKSYKGRWYRKDTMSPNEFILNAPLKSYADYEKLDNALLKSGFRIVPIKVDSPDSNMWRSKSAGRTVTPAQAAQMSHTDVPQPGQEPGSPLVDQYGNPIK